MNDTTRRFLSAIAERVPEGGRIVELRLFPAIRQGGIESGVAVVAVDQPISVPELFPTTVDDAAAIVGDDRPDAPVQASVFGALVDDAGNAAEAPDTERAVPLGRDRLADDQAAAAAHELVDTDIAHDEEEGTSEHDVEAVTTYIPNADTSDDDSVADALDDEMTTIVVQAQHDVGLAEARAAASPYASSDRPVARSAALEPPPLPDTGDGDAPGRAESTHGEMAGAGEDSPYADAPLPPEGPHREFLSDVADDAASDEEPDVMQLDDILALPSADGSTDSTDSEAPAVPDEAPSAPRTIQRYAILTASYRLTLKGPDRGKWDVDMTHEADAPLATVERVARGVAKRSGDGSEPEHFSGESLQQALDAPAWLETT